MPTIMKSWPYDPHYIKYSKLIEREKKILKTCAFRLYLQKSALQPVKYKLYSSRDLTKDIKMHSHSNFWLACLKWLANLVNYYRSFRCDANHLQFILNNLVHSQKKFNVASKIQCDAHFLQKSGFYAIGVHNFLNQETN